MSRTAEQRRADAARARRVRLANPEKYLAHAAKYRAKLTPEQKATRAANLKAWRMKNGKRIKRTETAYRPVRAEKARQRYQTDPAKRLSEHKAWRMRNPNYRREHYHRNHERYVADGPMSARSRRTRRLLKRFAATMAAGRRALSTQETAA